MWSSANGDYALDRSDLSSNNMDAAYAGTGNQLLANRCFLTLCDLEEYNLSYNKFTILPTTPLNVKTLRKLYAYTRQFIEWHESAHFRAIRWRRGCGAATVRADLAMDYLQEKPRDHAHGNATAFTDCRVHRCGLGHPRGLIRDHRTDGAWRLEHRAAQQPRERVPVNLERPQGHDRAPHR
ncbi:hypothetical protein ON010_g17501 [Phytophthora cinnamomi]|nr:hypothetical protein ON010_g17501 [Phytophthora cinnamomi]